VPVVKPPITPEVLNLIAEIDEFKGGWKAFRNLAPERLEALRRVATVESVASSTRIEGAKLTDREVETLLQNLEQKKFSTRDEQEVAGYAEVMQVVFESYASIPLTENHIKQLHALLLRHSDKDERHRGAYKTLSNSVAAFDADGNQLGIIFETSSPFATPLQMQDLVTWAEQALADKFLHPLLVVAMFVVRFLAIHPFQDGNGRLSRILTTLLLLKTSYVYVPYSSMESVVEANKEAYYLALRRTQTTLQQDEPEWEHWLLFFLRTLKKQKDNLLKKLEREHYFLQAMPQLAADILELAKENGRITTGEILLVTQAKRATVKNRLAELVSSALLQQHGKGKGTWYALPTSSAPATIPGLESKDEG
jgi:Fic family protein